MPRSVRNVLLIVGALFFLFVLADALRVFDDRPYVEVPHGSHSHYLPKDCGADLDAGQFPTRPPGPDERITCDGQIVAR